MGQVRRMTGLRSTRFRVGLVWGAICGALVLAGFGQYAAAQQPSGSDWRQFAQLQKQFAQAQQAGRVDQQAAAAEQIVALMERRFPRRLRFMGLALLADARAGQSRLPEAIKLHEQVLADLQTFRPASREEQSNAERMRGFSLRGLAACYGKQGNWDQAIPRFREAIEWWDHSQVAGANLMAADARKDLAFVYRNQGNTAQADKLFGQAVASLEKLAARERQAGTAAMILGHALGGWSSLDIQAGHYDRAEPKLRRALPLLAAARGIKHPITAQVLIDLGNVYDSQRRWNEAEPYYRAALGAYQETLGADHAETTKAIMSVARILRFQDRLDEALPLYRRAVETRTAKLGRDDAYTAYAVMNLGGTLSLTGQLDEADKLLREALAVFEKTHGAASGKSAETMMTLAALAARRDNDDEAKSLLDKVLEIDSQNPLNPRYMVHVHELRAKLLWKAGKQQEALDELKKAIDKAEFQRAHSTGAEFERAETFEQFSEELDTLIRWQAELNDAPGLFAAIERSKARSFLDELELADVDLFADLPPEKRAELAQREAALRQALADAQSRFDSLPQPKPDAKPSDDRRQVIRALIDARNDLYTYLTDARAQSPLYRELIAAKADLAPLEAIQGSLAEDELLLAYAIGGEASFVVAVRRDSADIHRLTVDADSAAALGIDAGGLTTDNLAQVLVDSEQSVFAGLSKRGELGPLQKQLAALWPVLVPKAERTALLSGDVAKLTVLPDGNLGLLPFEALVVSNTDSSPQYFLDAGPPVAYAPSASIWLNLAGRQQPPAVEREPVFTLGDPAYPQDDEAADRRLPVSLAVASLRASLSRLPFSGWESTWVRDHFRAAGLDVVQLKGAQATEAEFRRLAAGRQLVHLACHGMADNSYGNFFGMLALMPGDPADPANDGNLMMSEIYDLDLDGCELAILSACNTNYGPHQRGEGVWALSRGFLVAGARRVVASNWVINDQAGATLVSYYANYLSQADRAKEPRRYAAALRDAKRHVRGKQQWSHPFFWSSLVLVGPE